jgi:hypothetical protein
MCSTELMRSSGLLRSSGQMRSSGPGIWWQDSGRLRPAAARLAE